MFQPRWRLIVTGISLWACSLTAQTRVIPDAQQLTVADPDCDYFSAKRDRYGNPDGRGTRGLSEITTRVSALLATSPGGSRNHPGPQSVQPDSIDSYINADFVANNITPAPKTTDWEFIRRVTLDLTGRIPAPDRVISFVADASSDKRAKLVEELLSKPEWADKWTMYFGDLYQNTANKPSTSLNRFPTGRNAFYSWIHQSLVENKTYDRMASELISATGENSYTNGAINWMLNGYITGGPNQDIMDQSASFVFDTFLGMAHVNCLLCHNGAGHLDTLSLWGKRATRYQAWELASYLSHTQLARTPVDPSNTNIYYWSVLDNTRNFTTDYSLNTTTGNRPARVAPAGCKAGQPCFTVAPNYIFSGEGPKAGENYRVALARQITSDFQFARATVNYMWAQFFGRGIVDPPNTFDPARLDPDSPPPAPWTLQPSNPALLNALAKHFVKSQYDLKALMREIVNSQTYQLSSRYYGEWNAAWEPYFARKYVRRLWPEEVHDAVAQSSGNLPAYTIANFTDQGYGRISYAMQLPDVVGVPDGNNGATSLFLDSFFRGNRDDQVRKSDGSILQALNLMNNAFVVNRSHSAGATNSPLIVQNLTKSNSDLINTLFLNILSRFPTADEMAKASASIPASGTTRTAAVQDLVWSLYNKVDFTFNY